MQYMNVLVFIQRQGVQLYYMDQEAPIACVLPSSTMRDLEIINEKELESFLAKTLRPVSPKSQMQAILLLDDAVCFSSALEAGKEDEIKKTLINDVPFLRVANTTVTLTTGSLFVTTNQDLYESIARVLEARMYSVIGVYPWVAIQQLQILKSGETVGASFVKRLFDAVSSLKQVAFSYHNQFVPPAMPETHRKPAAAQTSRIGWIVFLSLALVYIFVMVAIAFART